jgi:hypothetical protein
MALAVLDGFLYAIGGRTEEESAMTVVERLALGEMDSSTAGSASRWELVAPLRHPRVSPGA